MTDREKERERILQEMLDEPFDNAKHVPLRPPRSEHEDSVPLAVGHQEIDNRASVAADSQAQAVANDQAFDAVSDGSIETSDRIIEREQIVIDDETGERVVAKQTTVIPSASRLRVANITRAQRIIYYIVRVITIILAVRFFLRLVGANPDNGFVSFWYSLSAPFHYPFSNIFGFEAPIDSGSNVLEISTLFAILIYWLIAFIIARGVAAFTNRSVINDSGSIA
jgi:hypothetical protein